MSEKDFDQILQQKLDELPREIRPQRDLWPGIDLAIEDYESTGNKTGFRYAIAASIAVLGIVGLLTYYSSAYFSGINSDLLAVVSSISEQHQDQKQFLLTRYQKQPALTENWEEQLSELEKAADVILSALKEDPNDVKLLKMLQQVQQQQIKLIKSVHDPEWL